MTGQVVGVASYRLRATVRRRLGDLLAVVVLVGLIGGVAMGALAAARRTQASFATYLASTNPSNVNATIIGGPGNGGGTVDDSPAATRAVARLPGVRHVESAVILSAAPLNPDGSPRLDTDTLVSTFVLASADGLFFDQDRLAVLEGRMADPRRPDEVVMTPTAAHLLGFHVGQVIPYGIYTDDQKNLPGFGTASVAPHRRLDARLVGLVQVNNAIVQDDIDRLPTYIFFTPALGREVLADGGLGTGNVVYYGIQLRGGDNAYVAAEHELAQRIAPGTTLQLHATEPVVAKVDRTVKPLAIALGVFGAVAALAALFIGAQVMARQLRTTRDERTILRALGASPAAIGADSLVATVGAIVVGTIVAAAVAVALSPLAPLGPVRPVYPGSALAFDWTVLGIGSAVLIGVLSAMAVALTVRGAPHREARRARLASPRTSNLTTMAVTAGLPPPAAVGVRFALESGRGSSSAPVRAALLGAVLAVTLVVVTLTFGSGLRTLVARPALYGWDWSYVLNPSSNVPPQALALLRHDRDVAAWTGYDYNIAEVDGQNIPFLFEGVHPATTPAVVPPILSGHGIRTNRDIVLGAATLAQLHKHVGDAVTVSFGAPRDAPVYIPPTRMVVVGTATLPAVGFSSVVADHTSMGTGALVAKGFEPAAFQQAISAPDPTLNGPGLVFVRLRPGVPAAAGHAGLVRIAAAANRALAADPTAAGQGGTVSVLGVQRPAEIVNYRSMGVTPALLASALAAGAAVALGITLAASVRRRRHDLALLKTLGFTQRQLAAVLAWQASVAALAGVVVGVPAGVALGRWLWTLFARQIYAVPHPTVPVVSVALVALGAFVLANVVAALPGRSAARTATAVLLRAE